MKKKNSNGINIDSTYRTYTQILNRIKSNAGSWLDKPIKKIARNEVEDFFIYEREK